MSQKPNPIISSRVIDRSEPVRPIEWIIPDFAARGRLTIVAGPPGVGKSTLMMHLAAEVGRREGTEVLYLDVENGPHHLALLADEMGIGAEVMFVDMGGLRLSDPAVLRQMTNEVYGRGVASLGVHGRKGSPLVVLDSARRFAPELSENSSDDMAPYISSLATFARATQAAVVLIHHSSTKSDAPSMRGTSAIEDQVDAAFTMRRVRGDMLRLDVAGEKFRMGAKPEAAEFRRLVDPLRFERVNAAPELPPLLADLAPIVGSGGLKFGEIAERVGVDTQNETQRKALQRALGSWSKVAHGCYAPS